MTTTPDVPDLDLSVALIRAAELDPTLGIFHVLLGLTTPEQIIRVSPTVSTALGLEERPEGEPLAAAREGGPWLTIAEAATRVGVSDQTVRRAMGRGLAHTVRPHGRPRYRLRATDVDTYFQPHHH